MTTKGEREQGYIQGFYAALKGVLYVADSADSTLADVTDAIHSTLEEMVEDGDMQYIDNRVDELIELVKLAEASGREEEFFATLDKHFGGK